MEEIAEMNKGKKGLKKKIMITVILLLLFGGYLFYSEFEIKQIEVNGNDRYTESEIKEIIGDYAVLHNSIYLWAKNKISPIKDIPFVDTINIQYASKNKIVVEVYEKAIAGCIANMGEYLYFDRDGIILESSQEKFGDVPQISGLKFQNFVLHEKLPIEDMDKFSLILNVTQLIDKYELPIEQVRFTIQDELILYKDDITIALGREDNLEIKLAELPNILAKADGLKGTLHMEEYTEKSKFVSFKDSKK